MVRLGRPYHFKYFKGCLPQFLLGPFLNTLTYLQRHFKNSSITYSSTSLINPFHITSLFLYPLETSENQMFSDVSRSYRKTLVKRKA